MVFQPLGGEGGGEEEGEGEWQGCCNIEKRHFVHQPLPAQRPNNL
jgi:hypothetical protein